MRINKKNKKKIIIAVVLGGIAGFSILNSMGGKNAVIEDQNKKLQELNSAINDLKKNPFEEKEKEKKFPAVVLTQDINTGDIFTEEMFKTEEFMEDALPEGYFKAPPLLVGKRAGKNLVKGQFVTSGDIQAETISVIEIPNDTRAVSIPVDKFKGLASHIRVGSSVDILKVDTPPQFIAQNLKIIALEAPPSSNQQANKFGAAQSAGTQYLTAPQATALTLLVPIDVVPKLVDAMFEGQLQIITRNNYDDKVVVTERELPAPPLEEETLPEVPEKEELPMPEMPAPEPRKIELIKASAISTIEFDSDEALSSSGEVKAGNTPSGDMAKLKELIDLVQ